MQPYLDFACKRYTNEKVLVLDKIVASNFYSQFPWVELPNPQDIVSKPIHSDKAKMDLLSSAHFIEKSILTSRKALHNRLKLNQRLATVCFSSFYMKRVRTEFCQISMHKDIEIVVSSVILPQSDLVAACLSIVCFAPGGDPCVFVDHEASHPISSCGPHLAVFIESKKRDFVPLACYNI
jgi:hypothetical protein